MAVCQVNSGGCVIAVCEVGNGGCGEALCSFSNTSDSIICSCPDDETLLDSGVACGSCDLGYDLDTSDGSCISKWCSLWS